MPGESDEFAGLDFEIADPVQSIHEESRRDSSGCTVHRSGLTPFNLGGTDILDGVALEAGLKRDEYDAKLGANKQAGVVVVYPVKPGSPKAMPFRRSATDQNITLYLHGVFKDFPMLRPSGKITCRVSRTTDKDGVPCAIINLRGSFTKVKGRTGQQAARNKPQQ